MTVENISWSVSTKECCRPRRGLNPRPPGLQLDGASNWATEAGPKPRHLKSGVFPVWPSSHYPPKLCFGAKIKLILYCHLNYHPIWSYDMRQCMTKPTIRPMWQVKTRISLYIHPVWQGFSFIPLWIARGLLMACVISKDWSDCVDAQADLSLCWLHKSYCRFCRALAHIVYKNICW